MTSKTIKEIADELGISKNTLEKRLARLRTNGTDMGRIVGRTRQYDDDEISQIISLYDTDNNTDIVSSEVSFYQEQIRELTKANSELRILLKQAQDDKGQLQLEYTETKLELEKEKSKGFWSKLFRR